MSIKEIIQQAIEEGIQSEVKLIEADWGVSNVSEKKWEFSDPYAKTACAIGMVFLKHQPPYVNSESESAAAFLGVSQEYVDGFTSGFDGLDPIDCGDETERQLMQEGYKDGLELRAKYKDKIVNSDNGES